MAYRVGQRVCCVNASRDYLGRKTGLIQNETYIVEEILPVDIHGDLGLVIAGVRSWHPSGGWQATRFRPVVSTSTGMAILEQIRRDMTNKELHPIFQDEQI